MSAPDPFADLLAQEAQPSVQDSAAEAQADLAAQQAAAPIPEPTFQSPSEPGPNIPDVQRPSSEPQAEEAAPAAEEPVAAAVTDHPDRSEAMRKRHREALDKVFGKPGVKYEVVKEVHLEGGQKFQTPFGNTGKNGWVIREIGTADAEGKGGTMYTIGASALKIAINEYKVIDPLPKKARGRKPKETVAEAFTETPVEVSAE